LGAASLSPSFLERVASPYAKVRGFLDVVFNIYLGGRRAFLPTHRPNHTYHQTTMSDIQSKIQQAASQNASLLQGLHETDSAPSQLEQQNAYIKDLDRQIAETTKRVTDLKRKTATELKDHEKYRDSHMRRFAHKATGQKEKFAEKASKEEKEYFDAIQAQKIAEDELVYVKDLKNIPNSSRPAQAASSSTRPALQLYLRRPHSQVPR
jgi:predicted RNase H-like nuclease (RuvC/YqgF family)